MNTTNSNNNITDNHWTTRRLLVWVTKYFEKHKIDSPRLSAEILLSHVLKCERLHLYMEVDRPADDQELKQLHSLVVRAVKHEPIAYLFGEAWFFGLQFKVTRDTLIPRPGTETVIEHILQHYRQVKCTDNTIIDHEKIQNTDANASRINPPVTIVDIGTGSGAIAISLAKHIRNSKILATDISEGALDTAQLNAQTHEVSSRIEFIQGSLLRAIENIPDLPGSIDYLVSNPPYISDIEWEAVAPNVKDFEPSSALRGGHNGLDFIKPLIRFGPEYLKVGGQIIIEIADSQADQVLEIAQQISRLTNSHILNDFEGLPRVLVATKIEPLTVSGINHSIN